MRKRKRSGERQRVLLADENAVFVNDNKPVCIGILRKSNIGAVFTYGLAKLVEILADGLGRVGELAGGLSVYLIKLAAELFHQQPRDGTTRAVDAVDNHLEPARGDCLQIDHLAHGIDMPAVRAGFGPLHADVFDGREIELPRLPYLLELLGSRRRKPRPFG